MDIVDTHFHLWRADDVRPTGVMAAAYLQRDVSWDDFERAVAETGVTEAVFVHAHGAEEGMREAEFAQTLGGRRPAVAALVAWAPLESPTLPKHLNALARFPILRGVRRVTQYEADPAFCARADFARGVRLAAERGLVIELCVQAHQLLGVRTVAQACPDAVIILEHLGKPRLEHLPTDEWRSGMSAVGRCGNVVCKVSPTIYTGDEPRLDAGIAARYVEHAVASFGWDRIVFGSNWPVSTGIVGYAEWVELLDRIMNGVAVADRRRFFAENARRIYSRPAA